MLLEARSERSRGRVDHLKRALLWGGVWLLSACTLPPELTQLSAPSEAPPASNSATAQADVASIQHYVDISGCWRPVGATQIHADGASFTIFAIASNTFVMGKAARTSIVVSEDLRFMEGNRDPDKPFFPPGYIHSTGSVSADNLAISRTLVGQSGAKEYRRCENVQEALPGMRTPVTAPEPTADPLATPSPEGTIAPLIPRTPLVTPEPAPSASPQASVSPQS